MALSPDRIYEWILSKFSKRELKLFVMTCMVGFVIHFVMYSEQLTNPDGRWFGGAYHYRSTYWETALGRWGLYLVDCTRGFLTSPLVTTTISIIVMSFSALFLVRVIDIQGKVNAAIVMIMMISMPCFSYAMSYWYCADAYSYAMLFSVLAVYFANKSGKINFILGILSMSMMLSLYQSYLGVTVGLCLICLFTSSCESASIIYFGKKCVRFLIMGILGMALYWGILQVALQIWNTELSSYSGADNIGIFNSLQNFPQRFLHTYHVFFEWLFGNEIILNTYWKRPHLYAGMLILFILFFSLLKGKLYQVLLRVGVVLLFPVGISIIEIAAPERDINILLSGGMCLIIPFFLKVTEMIDKRYLLKNVSVILVCAIVWSYILTDNATYLAVQTTTRRTETVLRDIYSKVLELEGYETNSKFMFAGTVSKQSAKIYTMSYGLWSDFDAFWNTYGGATKDWFFLYFDLLGMNLTLCNEDEYVQIANSQQFVDMPIYPAKGSIAMIDGIVCVKLSDEPPMP